MTPASGEILDPTRPCPEIPGGDGAAPRFRASRDGFCWRQFRAAGLIDVAEKVAAGRDLELDDAFALSRASLPLLGKMVELRPVENVRGDMSFHEALPIDRVSLPPESPRQIGLALTDWESFCRTLIALRSEFSPDSAAISWYPILGKPLDRNDGPDGDFTGAEVLRAIALARLVLPAEIQVRAPLATLGPKLAQVALGFRGLASGLRGPRWPEHPATRWWPTQACSMNSWKVAVGPL